MNPFDQASAPRAMAWRKPAQGLDFGFTGKESHEGTGGNIAHFMAATAYGKGVIAAEQYHVKANIEKFSSFVHEHFVSMFKKSANPRGKLFLQDGDPLGWRLKIYHSSKKSRSVSYQKHLSYCQAEVASRCFGSTGNTRFCCLFRKSQDYTGIDTY